MITNDYIYSRCKEKLVRPTISISEISLGNGSNHSRPYGQIYLPTPIIDFPAGSNFEVCVRERETLHNGIPFKFYLPEDFDITNANVVGLVSGSKYFEDTLTHHPLWRIFFSLHPNEGNYQDQLLPCVFLNYPLQHLYSL